MLLNAEKIEKIAHTLQDLVLTNYLHNVGSSLQCPFMFCSGKRIHKEQLIKSPHHHRKGKSWSRELRHFFAKFIAQDDQSNSDST